ncbi:hypothetical protein MRB53_039039 [Persea americana]|nr:hypothetical protein MRB53_039039 [Persea americana]
MPDRARACSFLLNHDMAKECDSKERVTRDLHDIDMRCSSNIEVIGKLCHGRTCSVCSLVPEVGARLHNVFIVQPCESSLQRRITVSKGTTVLHDE